MFNARQPLFVLFLVLVVTGSISSAAGDAGKPRLYRGWKDLKNTKLAHVEHLDLSKEMNPEKWPRSLKTAIRLKTLVVTGEKITDKHLQKFVKLPALQYLILDCTSVTDKAIARENRYRPDLKIIRSQRWAIDKISRLVHSSLGIFNDHYEIEVNNELIALLGKEHFYRITGVSTQHIPDIEQGPWSPIENGKFVPIKHFRTLKKLQLNWCFIDDEFMHSLSVMKDLEFLDLRPESKITDRGYEVLRHFTKLKHFSGIISDTAIENLAKNKSMEFFSISGPQLTDQGLSILAQMPELKSVYLGESKITGEGLRHLANCKKLRTLDLGKTGIRSLQSLPELESLRSLYLERAAIEDDGLKGLSNAPNLVSLKMGKTGITDAGLVHLVHTPQIEWLYIADTTITNTGLAHLKPLQKLESLNLGLDCPLNKAGARHLLELKSLRSISYIRTEKGVSEILLQHPTLRKINNSSLKKYHEKEMLAAEENNP